MHTVPAYIIAGAAYIRAWEHFTCETRPCTPSDLMHRAAACFVEQILSSGIRPLRLMILAGPGNNGGDGFFIARLLWQEGFLPEVYYLPTAGPRPAHLETCLQELIAAGLLVRPIHSRKDFPLFSPDTLVIDALFGAGLNRPLTDVAAELVAHLTDAAAACWSVDIPTGMGTDQFINGPIVRATKTISFECWKPAFFLAQNMPFIGKLDICSIGLSPDYPATTPSFYQWISTSLVRNLFHPRKGYEHKGHFGHSLLIAGSDGKMGAALLAAKACLRSGTGLLTLHLPEKYATEILVALPEAMQSIQEKGIPELSPYRAIGIGPGMGLDLTAATWLEKLIKNAGTPLVIDADALHLLSKRKELLDLVSPGSILTPHPKEFDRLFGNHDNEYDRLATALRLSRQYPWVIVVKGHHTQIFFEGKCWFNHTGNVGLAKGGSGDVLTGMLTALLAQQYNSLAAALLGVYLHGLAADIALTQNAAESLLATDVIECLGDAFKTLYPSNQL